MKRAMQATRRAVAGGLFSLLLPGGRAGAAEPPLRVMTFNVRLPLASDGANAWEHRREIAAATIAAADPDLIGTQELFKRQGDDLTARLPRYAWIGLDRRGGRADEHMGLFYRRDRLRPLRFGHFWLSDTPETPGSISWGHPFPRMATWAVFETLAGGRRFLAVNTHLPYRAEDEAAREKGAALLLQRIERLADGLPVVLTGDFNTAPGGKAHQLLTETLADAWSEARERRGPEGTFHAFTGQADRRIDWILTRGFRAERAETLARPKGERQVSDHFPVVATLAWA